MFGFFFFLGGGTFSHQEKFLHCFSKECFFFFLQSVESIQSLLYDLVNTWLSGCKMFRLLRCCYADFFSGDTSVFSCHL